MSLAAIQLTKRCEEPPVLSAQVPLLQSLLDSLLCVLPLADLGESVGCDCALETLELKRVARRHQVIVVDDLDERLDLAALGLAGLAHALGDLQRVALDAGNDGVGERVLLAAVVLRLDDDNLLAGVASAGDDGLIFNPCQILCLSTPYSHHLVRLPRIVLPAQTVLASILLLDAAFGNGNVSMSGNKWVGMHTTRPTLRTVGKTSVSIQLLLATSTAFR